MSNKDILMEALKFHGHNCWASVVGSKHMCIPVRGMTANLMAIEPVGKFEEAPVEALETSAGLREPQPSAHSSDRHLSIQLYGTPECRRYQKMRTAVQETAAELGLEIDLEEINDTNQLSQSNPLDLPRLVANGVVIASRNLPKKKILTEQFRNFKYGD